MIPVTHLRAGVIFKENNKILEVISYEHVKLGRGTANIKIKAKDLKTGALCEKNYLSGSKVEAAFLEKKDVQYLYCHDNQYFFIDLKSYEQVVINKDILGTKTVYLKENKKYRLLLDNGRPIKIEFPLKMEFKVTDAPPAVKGNTATNIWKDVKLENGLKVKTPLFIKNGDIIRIDTRIGEYVERV